MTNGDEDDEKDGCRRWRGGEQKERDRAVDSPPLMDSQKPKPHDKVDI